MQQLIVQQIIGLLDYSPVWEAMTHFTTHRNQNTADEIWLLQHLPVFTQGLAGKPEHVLNPQHIPIVQTDRGGQVTYHGPGQLMMYTLLDLKRLNIGVRELVKKLEQTIINLLHDLGIPAERREDAPGVYSEHKKICSIGLRVRKGCCYHGIALNVAMDLTAFQWINPCGYQGLQMTQIKDYCETESISQIQSRLISHFMSQFGYTHHIIQTKELLEFTNV